MNAGVVKSKWIKGVKPSDPVAKVARRALKLRFDGVWHYAPLAAHEAEEDIEYVHQLRISTRRARAALRVFVPLVRQKDLKWTKKRLRRLREAAGEARDMDVFATRLAELKSSHDADRLEPLTAHVAALRKNAQPHLVKSYRRARKDGFKKRYRRLLKRVGWKGKKSEPVFADFATQTLAGIVQDFFDAADEDLEDVRALHMLRIRGKHVRYALELLAGAFHKSFRKRLYPVFADVQERLGHINDHATGITLLQSWSQQMDANVQHALADLIVEEERQMQAACTDFRQWWSDDRVAGLKSWFGAVLGDPAGETHEDMFFVESEPSTRALETSTVSTRLVAGSISDAIATSEANVGDAEPGTVSPKSPLGYT